MSQTYTGGPSPNNLQASIREYYNRAGFLNGLNPGITGRIWYVTGEIPDDELPGVTPGSDSNTGRSPLNPFATLDRVLEFVDSYDIVVPRGIFREQVVAPDGVHDVSFIAPIVRPRQATNGGVATGGGCSFLAPTSPVATTPLFELVEQGWTFANIQGSPVANSAVFRLSNSEVLNGAGHSSFFNCYLSGGASGAIGIEDNGGCGFVQIKGSRFFALAVAIKGLNTAIAIPLMWEIGNVGSDKNTFAQNTSDILMSLSYGQIVGNDFLTAGSGSTNKVISTTALSAQGGNNHVRLNQFSNTAAQIQISNGYTGAASDTWVNYVNDNSGALKAGVPGA